jgi:ribosomal protein L11 methyltransferase
MEYLKLSCILNPVNPLNREIIVGELSLSGFESFVDTDQGVDAFIPSGLFNRSITEKLKEQYTELFSVSFEEAVIPDQNWNAEWERNSFKPLVIGCCVIRAPFHKDFPKCRYEILIDPEMAFGTGNHETTSLMIELLLESELKGKRVLDMGCGTGILGILAALRGAKAITAIDVDHRAYESTIRNARLNKIQNQKTLNGDATLLGTESFDLILANIHKNILIQDMKCYFENMNEGACLFMSGFYKEDVKAIKQKALELGLVYDGKLVRNNWVACRFHK